jgi:D-alanyl-lipoteichoic acid acyltransferase DltB (MBOAT superfamily)
MTFSSPDYPVFLIAVFFLYALSRLGGRSGAIGRTAVMVLLGDIVFLLVSKDLDTLWDPLGGTLLRLATAGGDSTAWQDWSLDVVLKWPVGFAVIAGAIAVGRRRGDWIASDRGQRLIARGIVVLLAAIAATVAISSATDSLDDVTATIAAYGHLVVLAVLGVGIGASLADARRPLGRVVILFVVSSLFYHAWAASMPGPYRYLLALLLGTIVLDYYLAIWIERTENPHARKLLVIVSLCSNLGILAFFKYTDFFTQDVLHLPVERLNLILPAGISFHTFQSLSYTIDVYRKRLRATRSVVTFATFVLFFPQLVAGPIVRAQDLLPQLDNLPALDLDKATVGVFRIVVGLFKKIAIADTLGLVIVDRVFDKPNHFSSIEVFVAVYAYALQIYYDFSAYSDIAIGSAQVLGFDLPENFRTPYRSANLQEFWRRWHISLSTWLRDYLYISLGGSRGRPARTYLNLIITMLLGGLWHGPRWTFIVWGALHGFGLAVTRYFQRRTSGDREEAWWLLGGCVLIAMVGFALQRFAMAELGTWPQLVMVWLYLTPLWAVLTAWLGGDRPEPVERPPTPSLWEALRHRPVPEILRLAMCAAAIGFLAVLAYAPTWMWIPCALVPWALGIAADLVERGVRLDKVEVELLALGRRTLAVLLVFHYVCLAWVFFRATSFDNALTVLRQIALVETDHGNLVPIVTTAIAVGFVCHFFADGSFRWLRDRFVQMPAWAQGATLAPIALVLRELGHTQIVPFIYFQF